MFEELPKRDKADVFMAIAHNLAMLGTCDRSMVGALIVRDGRCVSWGYNGAPPSMPHCDENFHGHLDPILPMTVIEENLKRDGCLNATHAEANALAFAARQGISTDGCTLFVTVSPCAVCAKLLIAAGIERVVFAVKYRKTDGLDILQLAGVNLEHRPEA